MGIQRLLRLAAADDAFRARLLALRDAAATAAGVELTSAERAVLRAVSASQLEGMTRQIPPIEAARREPLRRTAAAAAALLAGPALLACDGCAQSGGARPDVPPPSESATPAAPDVPATPAADPPPPADPAPEPTATIDELEPPRPPPVTRGISPDVPPEKKP